MYRIYMGLARVHHLRGWEDPIKADASIKTNRRIYSKRTTTPETGSGDAGSVEILINSTVRLVLEYLAPWNM